MVRFHSRINNHHGRHCKRRDKRQPATSPLTMVTKLDIEVPKSLSKQFLWSELQWRIRVLSMRLQLSAKAIGTSDMKFIAIAITSHTGGSTPGWHQAQGGPAKKQSARVRDDSDDINIVHRLCHRHSANCSTMQKQGAVVLYPFQHKQ